MDPALRFLAVIRRELGADDARLEFGGEPPTSPNVLWCELAPPWRVVAVFERQPEAIEQATERLRALADAFGPSATPDDAPIPGRSAAAQSASAQQALDDALGSVADSTGALGAAIIDDRSPVIWGCSMLLPPAADVDLAIRLARLRGHATEAGSTIVAWIDRPPPDAPASLLALRDALTVAGRGPDLEATVAVLGGIAAARGQGTDDGPEVLQRAVGGIYRVVLVFDRTFSPLQAKATLIRAAGLLERLVAALPPQTPPPGGGRVVRLHPQG